MASRPRVSHWVSQPCGWEHPGIGRMASSLARVWVNPHTAIKGREGPWVPDSSNLRHNSSPKEQFHMCTGWKASQTKHGCHLAQVTPPGTLSTKPLSKTMSRFERNWLHLRNVAKQQRDLPHNALGETTGIQLKHLEKVVWKTKREAYCSKM